MPALGPPLTALPSALSRKTFVSVDEVTLARTVFETRSIEDREPAALVVDQPIALKF
jgi:hypothetical protein